MVGRRRLGRASWSGLGMVVLGVAMLALGAAGLAARGGYQPSDQPLTLPDLTVPVAVLLAVLVIAAAIIVVLGVRPRGPGRRRSEPVSRGAWVGRVVLIVVALILLSQDRIRDPLADIARSGSGPPGPATETADPAPFWSWPVAVGFALLVVAVTLLVALALRRSTAASSQPSLQEAAEADDVRLATHLRAAVGAGRAAIHPAEPERTSIIGCYRAMEQSLAGAGAQRSKTDTPTDLLDRAVRSGLVTSDAAATLTDLFRLVRFTDRPVPAGSVEAASQALDQLDAEISRAVDAR